MKILFRVLLAVVAVTAVAWIWETIALQRIRAENEAFYNTQVAPQMAAQKQRLAEIEQAMIDRKSGKVVPLPPLLPFPEIGISKSMEMDYRQFSLVQNILFAKIVMVVGMTLLAVVALIGGYRQRLARAAPDRPADEGAGLLVGELVQQNKDLSASAGAGTGAPAVKIDGHRAIVVFRNFTFVRVFVGNPTLELVELPFSEILGVDEGSGKGRSYMYVRTTQGRVYLSDSVQPFRPLADALSDIVELNRSSPEAYAAALSREPKIQTPWYGWLIFVAAIGAIALWFWKAIT